MPFNLPFGFGHLEMEAGGEMISTPSIEAIDDENAAIEDALLHPIASPPLADVIQPGDRVALIVNDITRLTRTDLMLPPVVETLSRGGAGQIEVVFALGIHRHQTEDERLRILGPPLHARLRSFDHDASDEANLVAVGVTSRGNTVEINRRVLEADRIILTGEIIHHLIAGYSGGRKSLVPGVAGARTITFNHRMIFDPHCRSGLLDGNPAHEDLLEACALVEPDFLLNVVLTPEGRLARAVAGHYDQAHRKGCKAVDDVLTARIDEPFDTLIASAGGFPLDIDLRQAHKGMENAAAALKHGGTLLFYAECRTGLGHPAIGRYAAAYGNAAQMEEALQANFEIGGHKAWWLRRLGEHYEIHLVSELDPALVRRFGFEPVAINHHAERLREIAARPGRLGILLHAGFTLPRLSRSDDPGNGGNPSHGRNHNPAQHQCT